MKTKYELSKNEVEEAVAEYVAKRIGCEPRHCNPTVNVHEADKDPRCWVDAYATATVIVTEHQQGALAVR